MSDLVPTKRVFGFIKLIGGIFAAGLLSKQLYLFWKASYLDV